MTSLLLPGIRLNVLFSSRAGFLPQLVDLIWDRDKMDPEALVGHIQGIPPWFYGFRSVRAFLNPDPLDSFDAGQLEYAIDGGSRIPHD